MTPVRILHTTRIAPDGIHVVTWAAGSERSVTDDILAVLIELGACEIVEAKAYIAAPENKAARKPRKARA
jgi:hypothetical protein